MSKPREFWVEYDSYYKAVGVENKKPTYNGYSDDNEQVHVIEKSAYDKAMAQLKRIVNPETNADWDGDEIRETLKELGEL